MINDICLPLPISVSGIFGMFNTIALYSEYEATVLVFLKGQTRTVLLRHPYSGQASPETRRTRSMQARRGSGLSVHQPPAFVYNPKENGAPGVCYLDPNRKQTAAVLALFKCCGTLCQVGECSGI